MSKTERRSKTTAPKTADPPQSELTTEQVRAQAFEALYCEWLSLRGLDAADETDEAQNARLDRIDNLARTICVTPAPINNDVLRKMEVLEEVMIVEARDGHFIDRRSIVMLAGIRADILRFRNSAEG